MARSSWPLSELHVLSPSCLSRTSQHALGWKRPLNISQYNPCAMEGAVRRGSSRNMRHLSVPQPCWALLVLIFSTRRWDFSTWLLHTVLEHSVECCWPFALDMLSSWARGTWALPLHTCRGDCHSCERLQKIVDCSGMSRELIWPEFALPDGERSGRLVEI